MDLQRLRAEGGTTPRQQRAGVGIVRPHALLTATVRIVFTDLVPIVAATRWGD